MTTPSGEGRWGMAAPAPADRTLGWVAVIVLVSLALFVHATGRTTLGITLLVIAWLLVAVLSLDSTRHVALTARVRRLTLASLLACQLIAYLVENLAYLELVVFVASVRSLVLGLLVAVALLALAAVYAHDRFARVAAVGLIVTQFVLSSSMVVGGEPITSDVLKFQDIGTEVLLGGSNPYSAQYPDVYSPEVSARFYSPGVSVDGYLTRGFPYPPMSLLAAIPGQLLADVRMAHGAAIALTAALILAVGRRQYASRVGASLFLTLPGSVFMTLGGWTEAFVAVALAAVILAYRRRSAMTHIAFGLFLFMKQYGVLFAPLWSLVVEPNVVSGRDRIRRLVVGAMPWFLISIGFALWDLSAFVRSAITWQFIQPFRDDSLSLLVWLVDVFGEPPRFVILTAPIVVAACTLALVISKSPRLPAGLAAGVALVMMSFVLFSKQAFLNYYFLVVAASALALSAETTAGEAPSSTDHVIQSNASPSG